jgi:hypothetical protein
MEFPYSLALNLLFNLLFDKPACHRSEPPPFRPVQTLKVVAPQKIDIPEWVTHTPEDCFVGISAPSVSIEETRQQALNSAVSQILQAMGAEYDLTHESTLCGNLHRSRHELKERLTYTARWFVRSVQQNIKESEIQQVQGKYVCFTLIHFSPLKIERLRKLTIGPKIASRIIEKNNGQLLIEVRENNGISITLTDYELELTTNNHHAGIITLFAWKAPKTSSKSFEGVLPNKIALNDNSQAFSIPNPIPERGLKSIILGSENQVKIVLNGYDEIGRPLSLQVRGL